MTPWPNPGFNENDVWVAVDASLHSVYAAYARDDVLVVIDTDVCNGRYLSACAGLANPPTIHTGALPEAVVLDGQTQTLYTANQFDNDISVIDATRCNAEDTTGCRRRPLAASIPQPGGVAYDNATHTTYVTARANTVAMIDTRSCNAYRPAGCAATPHSVKVGEVPVAVALDRRTHTVYVANHGTGTSGTVSVLDARTCNATRTAGCARLARLPVPGGNPDDLVVDPATGTMYVATITRAGPNLLSVFNTTTCNAAETLGCQQTPATIQLGDSGDGFSLLTIAINDTTNTVYATNLITQPGNPLAFTGSSVYVINAATCDAADAGCSQVPAIVTVRASNLTNGSTPVGIAVDQATDTIYTADLDGGDVGTGTVGVINGATCNGQDTTGCGQTPTIVAAGFGAEGAAIDPKTRDVYVNNIEDSSVSILDGATCNAGTRRIVATRRPESVSASTREPTYPRPTSSATPQNRSRSIPQTTPRTYTTSAASPSSRCTDSRSPLLALRTSPAPTELRRPRPPTPLDFCFGSASIPKRSPTATGSSRCYNAAAKSSATGSRRTRSTEDVAVAGQFTPIAPLSQGPRRSRATIAAGPFAERAAGG